MLFVVILLTEIPIRGEDSRSRSIGGPVWIRPLHPVSDNMETERPKDPPYADEAVQGWK